MGGDSGPEVIVSGVIEAFKETQQDLVLVGDRTKLASLIEDYPSLSICHASEVIGMDESPSFAIRRKKDSSIVKAIQLLKKGEVDAVVTAGNTGACVAAATIYLRRIPGIDSPALACPLPTPEGMCLLLDVGASVDSKAEELLQFALMGDSYIRQIIKKESPSIGLLNIGEEENKGNRAAKKAYELLVDSGLNFIGNVEGRDIFSGKVDVAVCDGFVGNMILKSLEGLAEFMESTLKREIEKRPLSRVGALFMRGAYKVFKARTSYASYGGVPLLGIKGYCIITHGATSAYAIKNSIIVAQQEVKTGVNEEIERSVRSKILATASPRQTETSVDANTRSK